MALTNHIIIRVDASFSAGLGHLKRCLEIAYQLNVLNCTPIMVMNHDFDSTSLDNIPLEVIKLQSSKAEDFFALVDRFDCRVILFDLLHYNTIKDLSFLNAILARLKEKNKYLVGISDYESFDLLFDLQINPYRAVDLPGFISGYDYLVIADNIKNRQLKEVPDKKSMLISFGGSDVNRVSHTILRVLSKSKEVCHNWNLTVFVGEFFDEDHICQINKIVESNPSFNMVDGSQLQEEMGLYQLGIISGGLTKFELAYLGIPAIIVSQFNDEGVRAISYCASGSAYYLGNYEFLLEDIDRTIIQIESLLIDGGSIDKMAKAGKKMVDGLGGQRIAQLLTKMVMHS